MLDVPCLAAAVPLGEGNCHSHIFLVGRGGSASRTGVRMLSFLPCQPAITHTVSARNSKLPVPPWRDPHGCTHPSYQPGVPKPLLVQHWWHSNLHTGSCGMVLDSIGNWDIPSRPVQPLLCLPPALLTAVINLPRAFIWWQCPTYPETSLFLWTTLHISTGRDKQGSSSAFPEASGQKHRQQQMGDIPRQVPGWGGVAVAWLD